MCAGVLVSVIVEETGYKKFESIIRHFLFARALPLAPHHCTSWSRYWTFTATTLQNLTHYNDHD